MKNFATLAAFAAGADALVSRGNTCCFHLTASGGASGTVGQLSDGQNRIGGPLPEAQFCIDSSTGSITDSQGRGCILTPPTTQFQCDTGASPTPGFSISSSGLLASNGNTNFVACQTGENGELNIYTNPPPADVTGCVTVTLMADSCSAAMSSSVGPSSSTSQVVPRSTTPAVPLHSTSSVVPPPLTSSSMTSQTTSSVVPPPLTSSSMTSQTTSSVVPPPLTSSTTSSHSTSSSVTSSSTSSVVPPPSTSPKTTHSTSTSSVVPPPSTSSTTSHSTSSVVPPPSTSSVVPPPVTTPAVPVSTVSLVPGGPGGPGGPGSSAPACPACPACPPPQVSTVVSTVTVTNCPESSPPSQPTGSSPTSPPQSSAHSQPTSSSPSTPTQTSSSGCPADLPSGFQFPHLIIPISSSSPGTAAGTSLNGTVSSTESSIFNFDIPPSFSGMTCTLEFLFPTQAQLETSAFSFSGDGKVDFSELTSPATTATTFANAPSVKQDFGTTTLSPGHAYTISTFACPANQAVAFEMKNAGSTELDFFQDFNPCPIGLFITAQ